MRGAGGAEDLLGEIEVRFQLLVADPVVLDGHAFGDEFLAVAFLVVTAQAQFLGHDPEMHAGPVQAGATDAVAGKEGGELAVGQRGIVDPVADAHGALGEILEQLAAGVVGQLVEGVGVGTVGIGIAVLAALQRHHVEPGLGQLLGQDRSGPAEADHHRVHRFECRRHVQPLSPEIATGGKGYFSPRSAQSMKSARAPGNRPASSPPGRDCRRAADRRRSLRGCFAATGRRAAWPAGPAGRSGRLPGVAGCRPAPTAPARRTACPGWPCSSVPGRRCRPGRCRVAPASTDGRTPARRR